MNNKKSNKIKMKTARVSPNNILNKKLLSRSTSMCDLRERHVHPKKAETIHGLRERHVHPATHGCAKTLTSDIVRFGIVHGLGSFHEAHLESPCTSIRLDDGDRVHDGGMLLEVVVAVVAFV